MSGGSWNYVYGRFADVSDQLCASGNPQRRALGRLVSLIADALHDIEWVDSGDYGKDGADEAIRKALGERGPGLTLEEFNNELKRLAEQIEGILKR